jgi:Cu(I)/Ag(I) efflux system membrane protein CusA/SilA
MFETTIQFKPRDQWRPGMTPEKLVEELDRIVQGAGPDQHLGAADPQPHRHAGHRHQEPGRHQGGRADLAEIDRVTREIERVVKQRARRHLGAGRALTGGRYIDVDIDRAPRRATAEHRRRAGGGLGRHRRREHRRDRRGPGALPDQRALPARMRDSLEKLRNCPSSARAGSRSRSATWRQMRISDGPPMLRSENARLSGWVYVDMRGRDLAFGGARGCRRRCAQVKLPPAIRWRGRASSNSGTRRWQAQAGGAVHAADHLRAALPDLPPLGRGPADHGHAALRAGRRHLAAVGCWATTCRWRAWSASSRWPGWRPSSA